MDFINIKQVIIVQEKSILFLEKKWKVCELGLLKIFDEQMDAGLGRNG